MKTWLAMLLVTASLILSSPPLSAGTESDSRAGTSIQAQASKYPVEYFDVQVEGQPLRMAYRDVRPKTENGVPVLLLHGKNFSGFYWERVIEDLVKKGHRVIAPDQLGFGRSSRPDIHYSFHGLADLTRRLLDHLGVKASIVVGHSMGGMLASRYALSYPDRVAKLVLENPIGLEDYRALVPYTPIDQQFAEELKASLDSMRKYQKTYYVQWKPEYEPYVLDQAQWLDTGEWPRDAKSSALTYEMIYTQPVVHEFPRIRVPTLLIIGQSDRTVVGKAKLPPSLRDKAGQYPELGKKTQAAIPGSKLVEIPNCGHIPHIEAYPAFFDALTSWIDK